LLPGVALLPLVFVAVLAVNAFSAQSAGKPGQGSTSAPSPEVSNLAQEARKALDKGDTDTAVRDYEKLVKLAPAVSDYQLNLGIAYYNARQLADAAPAFQRALKLKPQLALARYYLEATWAETGRCQEALPGIRKDAAHIADADLKRAVETDGLKCAMSFDEEDAALDLLHMLRRDFPNDPEALYLTVHVYSDLSTRASQRLLNTDPKSYQVRELYAESLEEQQKWPEAEAEYRGILEMYPHLPGIHYRIGRLLLTQPKSSDTVEKAKHEFAEELKIDPRNAGAEYVLGELNRQAREFPEAIGHFRHATQLDPRLFDAYLGLAKSLAGAGQTADAIPPLEAAIKLQPENPTAHYQLAAAYRSVGRREDADKETAAYQRTATKARQDLQDIRSAVTGRKTPAQTETSPR